MTVAPRTDGGGSDPSGSDPSGAAAAGAGPPRPPPPRPPPPPRAPPPAPPAAAPRAAPLRLIFREPALERAYRDAANGALLAGGHDLTAAFVILGLYAASTVYVLYFSSALEGAFLRTCTPLLGSGLGVSLVNMLVVASLSRAQAGARRRRAQLERRLAGANAGAGAGGAGGAGAGAGAGALRLLVEAEAAAEARAARRRGAWILFATVADHVPSLLFNPRCISYWDPNWRRAAQSVASDSGAVWNAFSSMQRLPASVWGAMPSRLAAWVLSAALLAPEVCRKFEASPYHRALMRRAYRRLAAAAAPARLAASSSSRAPLPLLHGGGDADPGPCSCRVIVGGCMLVLGLLLPLWATWALERRARRRWLAARRRPPCPDLAPYPGAARLLVPLAAAGATWQVLRALGAAACPLALPPPPPG